MWKVALSPNASGISTDPVLFSENHYRVFGDCVSHSSLLGPFMKELLQFTNRACADARSAAKHGLDTGASSLGRPGRPVSSATAHRATDDDPPVRKAARAMTYAIPDELSPLGTSDGIPVVQYRATPVRCPFPSNRRMQLSLPLPRFTTPDAASDNV